MVRSDGVKSERTTACDVTQFKRLAAFRPRTRRRRATRRLPRRFGPVGFGRAKLAPMVAGFFPASERDTALRLLADALFFVSSENIETLVLVTPWLHTAWTAANLYLGSLGAPGLDGQEARVVGRSIDQTCYVFPSYFDEENPFADVVVHEAAHLLHNCKRQRAGLLHSQTREWLLTIDYAKRETFTHVCGACSRIIDQAFRPAERARRCTPHAANHVPACDEIDPEELVSILRESVGARNGWQRIRR